ncbi:hypothetical protein PQR70_09285 [Paraburkholderia madseniana]|uniref:hypothetical protein n=1 Tax=Paraburkholderia madseniana TaxID=2599607 RepID=UPI0038B9C2C5
MDATGFVLSITFTLVKPAAAAGAGRPARFDPERATTKVRRGEVLSSTSFRFEHTPAILVEITHLGGGGALAEVINRICSRIWAKTVPK